MAAFSQKLLYVTFTTILSLCLVLSQAELQRFEQAAKADGSLSFLVVGDWGRRGDYNQSDVAHQVIIPSYTFLFLPYHIMHVYIIYTF